MVSRLQLAHSLRNSFDTNCAGLGKLSGLESEVTDQEYLARLLEILLPGNKEFQATLRFIDYSGRGYIILERLIETLAFAISDAKPATILQFPVEISEILRIQDFALIFYRITMLGQIGNTLLKDVCTEFSRLLPAQLRVEGTFLRAMIPHRQRFTKPQLYQLYLYANICHADTEDSILLNFLVTYARKCPNSYIQFPENYELTNTIYLTAENNAYLPMPVSQVPRQQYLDNPTLYILDEGLSKDNLNQNRAIVQYQQREVPKKFIENIIYIPTTTPPVFVYMENKTEPEISLSGIFPTPSSRMSIPSRGFKRGKGGVFTSCPTCKKSYRLGGLRIYHNSECPHPQHITCLSDKCPTCQVKLSGQEYLDIAHCPGESEFSRVFNQIINPDVLWNYIECTSPNTGDIKSRYTGPRLIPQDINYEKYIELWREITLVDLLQGNDPNVDRDYYGFRWSFRTDNDFSVDDFLCTVPIEKPETLYWDARKILETLLGSGILRGDPTVILPGAVDTNSAESLISIVGNLRSGISAQSLTNFLLAPRRCRYGGDVVRAGMVLGDLVHYKKEKWTIESYDQKRSQFYLKHTGILKSEYAHPSALNYIPRRVLYDNKVEGVDNLNPENRTLTLVNKKEVGYDDVKFLYDTPMTINGIPVAILSAIGKNEYMVKVLDGRFEKIPGNRLSL